MLNAQVSIPGQVLLEALIAEVNAGVRLLLFRQPNEAGQPMQAAPKNSQTA
ncbi:MAG TPA: hypothetical protein VGJ22_04600 [Anaerolineales bacterium]